MENNPLFVGMDGPLVKLEKLEKEIKQNNFNKLKRKDKIRQMKKLREYQREATRYLERKKKAVEKSIFKMNKKSQELLDILEEYNFEKFKEKYGKVS